MKELSSEQRTLLAFVLSLIVLLVWSSFYKPTPPPRRAALPPVTPAQTQTEPANKPAAPTTPAAVSAAPPAATTVAPRAASQEKTIAVENSLYRVEFSNRGALVRSWQLKNYTDDAKPPHTLDVVHAPEIKEGQEWPLTLYIPENAQLQEKANSALYEVTPSDASVEAPGELSFTWSDGHLAIVKRLKFSHNHVVDLESSVELDGKPLPHGIAWRGGFGDLTAEQALEQVMVFFRTGGKLQTIALKKLGTAGHPEQPILQTGAVDYAGIEDHYFAAAFLPSSGGTPVDFWQWQTERNTVQEEKSAKQPVAEVAAGSTAAGSLAMRLYVGPKSLSELGKVNASLRELVQYGWFAVIAEPLFYILQYIHRFVPNYGWAIVVLTLLINFALLPLKVKSWRSMQKMQKAMPEVKAIQNKYSKYSMRDPRKQEMNKEVMAVYQREGVNPMGGCLPMAVQMPIWIALYRMLGVAIELRHAPWFGWVHDLSAHDPYYILPALMVLTMYWMQKMVPSTTVDPTQQKMMTLMPVFFGVMFFRVQAGLVVYILTSNIVGIAQQWYLNKNTPAPVSVKKKKRQ